MGCVISLHILVLALSSSVQAQVQPPAFNSNAAAAYESLLRLRTTATVLHTTAHPDDEDGALITWLARGQGVRTGLLTLNRGEGGADLIGPELYDALGLVRTEELLAAGRYYGVDQFFTRVTDFGFSKRMDETLEHWGEENVLRDCVRVVRLYRPDIIISRFHGAARDGHGNHQTAGLMSTEVFTAAADPNRFPEQLREGLRPWQVKKLYRSVRENESGATLKIDTGAYDPLIGMSYRQIAATGLSFQRSQGSGGRRADPGPAISAVALVENALGEKSARETSLFEGLDTSLKGLAKLAPQLDLEPALGEIEKDVERAIEAFDARDPSRVLEPQIVPALRNLRALIGKVNDASIDRDVKYDLLFRLRNKEDEFVRAGNLLEGVSFEALVDAPPFSMAIPGQKFGVTGKLTNRSNVKLEEVELGLNVPEQIQFTAQPGRRGSIGYNEQVKRQFEVTIGEDAGYTRPYWSRKDEYRDHLYQLDQPQYLNLPYAPPEIVATASYRVAGEPFNVAQPVQTVSMEAAVGEQRSLLKIAPAISVALSPRRGVIPVARRSTVIDVHAQIMSNVKGPADVKVRLELPPGWTATPPDTELHFAHEGEIQNADYRVSVPQVAPAKSYTLQALAEYKGKQYREGYQVIAHRDLETRHLYQSATALLAGIDVKVAPGLKVGYIMGVGDEVPESLAQIGVKPQMLGPADLATGNLAQFDTILVGIRASAVRPDYRTYNSRLLDYVTNGGNLIVQYQTQEFDAIPYGPYPFQMGRNAEEVSEEDSKVTILDPSNPIFAGPNKITAPDFDGWVEERGSKFMSEWDSHYTPLIECHDREQAPQKGGMLQAHYGKGTFTYAAYAFYRQLPAGVPGAFRLFANMISLGK
ncbi:MAG: PIG-L family deacetylase [Bryobacteraceae bacterium]|jgi:LmbE family N-acetylglucosaminyl deacetylase